MSRVIRMGLEYEGTRYYGFTLQPGLPTVQAAVEAALGEILRHPVRVTPAGRTDTGVHASGQVLSFKTEARLSGVAIRRALNARLPDDIVARGGVEAEPDFDARRNALRRHYRYTIWNAEEPDLWRRRYSLHLPAALDQGAMQEAASSLVGRYDYSSFIGHASQQAAPITPLRTVERADWIREGDMLHFDCSADAFARHMMRSFVGTLLWVGRGKLSPKEFRAILGARDRRAAGPTAPARGLTLVKVDYDPGSQP